MRDILADIDRFLQAGEKLALATVVKTWGSAPRKVGAHMLVTEKREIAGSVSGGCVEGAVIEIGLEVLKTGQPQLVHFGVPDENAWEVGLACGGEIDVFVQPFPAESYSFLHKGLTDQVPITTATVIRGPEGPLGKTLTRAGSKTQDLRSSLDPTLAEPIASLLREERVESPQIITVEGEQNQSVELFVNLYPPSQKLVIVGGVHIAVALAKIAKTLDFRTIIVDPRRAFGNQTRFPEIDQLLQTWPEEAFNEIGLDSSTAVATLTHDPKIDDPALIAALNSEAFYIGALGSQKTQAKRRTRLKEQGVSEKQLSRIRGPIGLDIGAVTPEEIALSIMAEIVAAQHERRGQA